MDDQEKKPRISRKGWLVIVGVSALIVGFAAGIWGSAAERESLQDRLDAANAEIEDYAAKHDALVASGERAVKALRAKDAYLDARKRQLDRRSSKIEAAEEQVKRNTITDGIWKVGTDFDPGTYRAPGGGGCYWALLNSADTSDILNNGGFGPNQTLTIDSAWFETSGCGAWEKIG